MGDKWLTRRPGSAASTWTRVKNSDASKEHDNHSQRRWTTTSALLVRPGRRATTSNPTHLEAEAMGRWPSSSVITHLTKAPTPRAILSEEGKDDRARLRANVCGSSIPWTAPASSASRRARLGSARGLVEFGLPGPEQSTTGSAPRPDERASPAASRRPPGPASRHRQPHRPPAVASRTRRSVGR